MARTPKSLLDFSKRKIPTEGQHFDLSGEVHLTPQQSCLACGAAVEYMLRTDLGVPARSVELRLAMHSWNRNVREQMLARANEKKLREGRGVDRITLLITGFPCTKEEIAEKTGLSPSYVHRMIKEMKPKPLKLEGTGIGRRPGQYYFEGEAGLSWVVPEEETPDAPHEAPVAPEPEVYKPTSNYLTAREEEPEEFRDEFAEEYDRLRQLEAVEHAEEGEDDEFLFDSDEHEFLDARSTVEVGAEGTKRGQVESSQAADKGQSEPSDEQIMQALGRLQAKKKPVKKADPKPSRAAQEIPNPNACKHITQLVGGQVQCVVCGVWGVRP